MAQELLTHFIQWQENILYLLKGNESSLWINEISHQMWKSAVICHVHVSKMVFTLAHKSSNQNVHIRVNIHFRSNHVQHSTFLRSTINFGAVLFLLVQVDLIMPVKSHFNSESDIRDWCLIVWDLHLGSADCFVIPLMPTKNNWIWYSM